MSDATSTSMRRRRFRCGVALFVLGLAAPALIPLVSTADLPVSWKTVISGLLAIGVPEIMMVVAAAVMGKEGYAELKRRLGGILRRYGPPQTVGRTRYRIGLVMFVAPLLLGWLGPYLSHYFASYATHLLGWSLGGDAVFLASFLVLGGDFWDKARSLFLHGARAVLPAAAAAPGADSC